MAARAKRYGGISRYLLNVRGYVMHSSELRMHLVTQGILSSVGPMPKDLEATTYVSGSDGTPVLIKIYKSAGRMGRRVFAQCPECTQEVCAGHLHQHVQAHHPVAPSWEI